jgi:regulatory protein
MDENKVTAITAQKRNPNRVNVFLDGEYRFSLSRIVAAWLEPGRILDQKQIDELIDKDTEENVLQSALRFLDFRPRSEGEIRIKLKQKGFETEKIDVVVSKLRTSNVLHDDHFAASWVDSRNEFHPRSQKLIRYELRNKGINDQQIDKALKSSANDHELALKAGKKVARRYSGLDWQEFRKKLSTHLARRGFSYDIVSPVVKMIWDELQSETILMENEESGE